MHMNLNDKYRKIPFNAFQKGKFLGIYIIRWIEAFMFLFLTGFLIWLTPFVVKIKIICSIVIGTALFALALHGIKNRSITEICADIIADSKNKRKYSLGSVSDDRKRNFYDEDQFGNESNFEKGIKFIKKTAREFDEKYGK